MCWCFSRCVIWFCSGLSWKTRRLHPQTPRLERVQKHGLRLHAHASDQHHTPVPGAGVWRPGNSRFTQRVCVCEIWCLTLTVCSTAKWSIRWRWWRRNTERTPGAEHHDVNPVYGETHFNQTNEGMRIKFDTLQQHMLWVLQTLYRQIYYAGPYSPSSNRFLQDLHLDWIRVKMSSLIF